MKDRSGPLRLEIAGGIASGKTTLARLLKPIGVVPIHERFRRNPFFEAFYRDPVGVALEAEITFLLQHYHDQKNAAKTSKLYCADFSLLLDRAYADVTLSRSNRRVFEVVRRRVETQLPRRHLTIYLECSPSVLLGRIRRRDRLAERAIGIQYLSKVDRALRRVIGSLPRAERVLRIDSEILDFAHCPAAGLKVRKEVRRAIQAR